MAKSQTQEVVDLQFQVRGENEEFLIALPDGRLFGRTKDYSIFDLDPANRPINKDNLDSKVKQNLKKDLLSSYPIAVAAQADGRWVVRDGQHRLKMAEINGRWIYFIASDMDVEDVPEINASQSRWTGDDFLHHWVVMGAPEYLKLREFLKRFPWMKMNTAKDLTSYGDRRKQDFASGNYMCNDLEFATTVALACEDWQGIVSFWSEATFVYAIAMCHEHEGFDHTRLLHKARRQVVDLHKCVNVAQYMEMFDQLYNFQARESTRLHLEKLNPNSSRRRQDRRQRRRRGEAV